MSSDSTARDSDLLAYAKAMDLALHRIRALVDGLPYTAEGLKAGIREILASVNLPRPAEKTFLATMGDVGPQPPPGVVVDLSKIRVGPDRTFWPEGRMSVEREDDGVYAPVDIRWGRKWGSLAEIIAFFESHPIHQRADISVPVTPPAAEP